MVSVIAIEREYGSGGGGIACKLARRLGWQLWDRQFAAEIAKRLRCDVRKVEEREEKLDTTFYRLAKIFMRGSHEEAFTGGGLETLDAETLSHLFEKVTKDLASKGNCVIVGRAAPYFLRDDPNACRVFIYASEGEKMNRLLALGKSRAEAEQLIITVDAERAAFVKKYYGKCWPLRELYHLMLNAELGDETAMDLILHGVELINRQQQTRVSA